jgi:hypothetical protein
MRTRRPEPHPGRRIRTGRPDRRRPGPLRAAPGPVRAVRRRGQRPARDHRPASRRGGRRAAPGTDRAGASRHGTHPAAVPAHARPPSHWSARHAATHPSALAAGLRGIFSRVWRRKVTAPAKRGLSRRKTGTAPGSSTRDATVSRSTGAAAAPAGRPRRGWRPARVPTSSRPPGPRPPAGTGPGHRRCPPVRIAAQAAARPRRRSRAMTPSRPRVRRHRQPVAGR